MAVFRATPTVNGRLAPTAFRNARLQAGDVSLARLSYTTREDFDAYVVAPKTASDPLQGVVTCAVEVLRGLRIDIPYTSPVTALRAICVIDRVEVGDHDGHAALMYCEEQQSIQGKKTKERIRADIAAALASAFGEVKALDVVFPSIAGD
jgi:hypothetical protein